MRRHADATILEFVYVLYFLVFFMENTHLNFAFYYVHILDYIRTYALFQRRNII